MRTFTNRRQRFFNQFERFADAKVCNSENARRLWLKHYPQWSSKYITIYNPVNIPETVLTKAKKHSQSDRLTITIAASYHTLKNPLRVIEAVHRLSDEQKKRLNLVWHGRQEIVAGNTITYDKTAALVEEYGLQSVIHLKEATNNIYNVMADSDVIGLFSLVEGLPNAICEGMMLGKPIILSRVSDYDVLTSGNGVLCDPRSVDSIRDAIATLLDASPETLKEMGAVSQEKAKTLFSKDHVCDQWIALIENL